MVFSIHTFELTLESKPAFNRWNHEVKHDLKPAKYDGVPTDYSLHDDGITIKYDNRHKKRIRLIVNPSRVLGGDDLELWKPKSSNITELIERLNDHIEGYFNSDYGLNDFRLTRIDFTVNIDVGNPKTVSDYIKVFHSIGKVKGYSMKYNKQDYSAGRIDKDLSFDLVGNSNGIEFTVYDKQAQLREGGQPKSRVKMAEGILRVEVRLAGVKVINKSTNREASTARQIMELSKRSEDIFMTVFRHIVPRGDFYKKKTAERIIKDGIPEKTLRRKMLRLIELIPEKKSLLLAQKELDDRGIKETMKKFAELDLSPVTLSKRQTMKKLDSLYSHLA